MFSVNKASRKSKDPTYEYWLNIIKIFRYLKGKPNYGLRYRKDAKMNLRAYVDSDFGGDKETRKSTKGYVILFDSTPTTWYSKLQKSVAVSTVESEYYAIDE